MYASALITQGNLTELLIIQPSLYQLLQQLHDIKFRPSVMHKQMSSSLPICAASRKHGHRSNTRCSTYKMIAD